jgi:phytoene synthase
VFADLLQAMQMDVEGYTDKSWKDLEQYCYGVAGTVGLMMCFVVGVKDQRAFPYAIALGKAMQLTNIARDLQSDLNRGRCYIPKEWRSSTTLVVAAPKVEKDFWPKYAKKLLLKAREGYRIGRLGIGFLPFRAGLAIQIASLVYEKIGDKILARGASAWDERCYTSLAEKSWIALREFLIWPATYLFISLKLKKLLAQTGPKTTQDFSQDFEHFSQDFIQDSSQDFSQDFVEE